MTCGFEGRHMVQCAVIRRQDMDPASRHLATLNPLCSTPEALAVSGGVPASMATPAASRWKESEEIMWGEGGEGGEGAFTGFARTQDLVWSGWDAPCRGARLQRSRFSVLTA